ncbi:SET domain-containing protein [[Collinsella] massiliensis]|uniref:SET domain-containing protein n=1 Tax=[Collinsella] massiliensis TaxID=1232426 RepID=A0A1Y3XQY5_9ACTN|nr:SET domain-containing protein [[Collinsella] massiliensis]OUN87966.1 hypothetical protein B5G02_06780 [[Collinsella] massiliensis]
MGIDENAFAYVLDTIPLGYIAPSPVHGNGLFARCAIPAGSVIATLDGQVMSWSTYRELRDSIDSTSPILFYEWNALEQNTLLVRPFRTKYSFINHSRSPNLQIERFPLRVVALSDIAQDEEFLLDYRKEPLNEEYLNGHGRTYL